jgi:predicted DNA-binding protein YlxM (UPF0122 family)
MIEEKIRLGDLYAFYGQLLTEKQQKMIELHIYEDLSLGEIADQSSITRQAVYDAVRSSDRILNNYEDKLGLVERFENHRQELFSINEDLDRLKVLVEIDPEINAILENLMQRINRLTD